VKLLVLTVGRVKGALASAVAEYEDRMRRYWKLDVVEVEAGASGRAHDPRRVRDAEGERILARIPEGFEVLALTRTGSQMSSPVLAELLGARALAAAPGVTFVVGGAYGLSEAVLSRAARRLSLSEMTLPHEMARLMLAEQLYRAGTILRGEPYHKGS
jgi:23S rRNA (pseudouridine1915-N3)-methyltransferase